MKADEITVYVTSSGIKAASGECSSCQSHLFLLNPVSTIRKHTPSPSSLLLLDAPSLLHAAPRRIWLIKRRNPGQKCFQNTCGWKPVTRNTAKPGADAEKAFAYLCIWLARNPCWVDLRGELGMGARSCWGWQLGMPRRPPRARPRAPAWVCMSGSGCPVALLPGYRSGNDDLKMKQGKSRCRSGLQPETGARLRGSEPQLVGTYWARCDPSFS